MTSIVNTSAKPVNTVFGGSAEAPIAERTSERTTTMRTNDVHITSTSGSTAKNANESRTSSDTVAWGPASNGNALFMHEG